MLIAFLDLVEEVGDKEKFEWIYHNYQYMMFYTAKGILNDAALAQDAVQEALLYLALNIKKIDDVRSHMTKNYVFIITKHRAIDILRKRNQDKSLWISDFCGVEDIYKIDVNVLSDIAVQEIVEIILNMPDIYSEVLELNIVYSLKIKEIAQIVNKDYELVKKRLQRGKEKLRNELIEKGYEQKI